MQVEKNALLVKPARRFVAPARPAFPGRRWKQAPRATLVVLRSGLPGQAVPAIPGATPSHLETPGRSLTTLRSCASVVVSPLPVP